MFWDELYIKRQPPPYVHQTYKTRLCVRVYVHLRACLRIVFNTAEWILEGMNVRAGLGVDCHHDDCVSQRQVSLLIWFWDLGWGVVVCVVWGGGVVSDPRPNLSVSAWSDLRFPLSDEFFRISQGKKSPVTVPLCQRNNFL